MFPSLARFAGFYLAGGTALALQIGHRVSVDFDLFSDELIDRALLAQVQRIFVGIQLSPLVNNGDELTVLADGVKITFLAYPFPAQEPFVIYDGLPLLPVSEIAATKAYTIGRRGSFKDYVDLYYVLAEKHATLAGIIADAERKFGTDFNSRLFLEQLVYVADLDDTEVQFLKTPLTATEAQTFFEEQVRQIGSSI